LIAELPGAVLCVIGSHLDPSGSDGKSKFVTGMLSIGFGGELG